MMSRLHSNQQMMEVTLSLENRSSATSANRMFKLRIMTRFGDQRGFKKYIILVLLAAVIPLASVVHGIELEKKHYLTLIIGNYVHGFKEFDTSVVSFDDSISIGIYYDISTQKETRADQLANRFRVNIPKILQKYSWANDVEVIVNVYSEDRTGRGY